MSKITPAHSSPSVLRILVEVERQGATAYGIRKSTGLSLSAVQHVLSGKGAPSIHTVEAIAKALGLTVEIRKAKR